MTNLYAYVQIHMKMCPPWLYAYAPEACQKQLAQHSATSVQQKTVLFMMWALCRGAP